MNELLSSLKSDLLDRRMLPLLALLGVALLGALAYALFGGGSGSSATPSAAAGSAVATPPSLAVSQAPANPNGPVAETTEGSRYQHRGGSHNPFTPLAAAKTASAATTSGGSSSTGSGSSSKTSTSTSASGSGSSSSGASGSSGGGATPAEPPAKPAPSKPRKPKNVYVVDVLYGVKPASAQELSSLTPFTDLKRLEPLPSAQHPRIVYAGVNSTGTAALFTLAGEAIIGGQGTCVPSATQCEAVALAPGKTEEFGYLEEDGASTTYVLTVVSIEKRGASAATAARLNRADKAGRALMRRLAPPLLRRLRFSFARGVLVYVLHGHR